MYRHSACEEVVDDEALTAGVEVIGKHNTYLLHRDLELERVDADKILGTPMLISSDFSIGEPESSPSHPHRSVSLRISQGEGLSACP